mmetsp:Transcript_145244/g.267852  ORF Transcript_145244/g.267852 Transcript_145244/m.267852 type:complete len:296 (+) Transcript_145244:448-1335(+)
MGSGVETKIVTVHAAALATASAGPAQHCHCHEACAAVQLWPGDPPKPRSQPASALLSLPASLCAPHVAAASRLPRRRTRGSHSHPWAAASREALPKVVASCQAACPGPFPEACPAVACPWEETFREASLVVETFQEACPPSLFRRAPWTSKCSPNTRSKRSRRGCPAAYHHVSGSLPWASARVSPQCSGSSLSFHSAPRCPNFYYSCFHWQIRFCCCFALPPPSSSSWQACASSSMLPPHHPSRDRLPGWWAASRAQPLCRDQPHHRVLRQPHRCCFPRLLHGNALQLTHDPKVS